MKARVPLKKNISQSDSTEIFNAHQLLIFFQNSFLRLFIGTAGKEEKGTEGKIKFRWCQSLKGLAVHFFEKSILNFDFC